MESVCIKHCNFKELVRDKIFLIPPYQRPYDWEDTHTGDLWNDINLIPPGKQYPMDSIKIQKVDNEQYITNQLETLLVYKIVDGQQRITTLLILIKALTTYMDNTNYKYTLNDNYIFTHLKDNRSIYRLFLQEELNACFQKLMNIKTVMEQVEKKADMKSKGRINCAYRYFHSKLNEKKTQYIDNEHFQEYLYLLFLKISEQLYFTEVVVGEKTDTAVLFENSNYRGKQLTDIQRLKSMFIHVSTMNSSDNPLTNKINNTWATIYKTLMHADLSKESDEQQFISYVWQSVHQGPIEKDVYKSIFHHFDYTNPNIHNMISNFLDILTSSVSLYADIYSPFRADAFVTHGAFQHELQDLAINMHRIGGGLPLFFPMFFALHNKKIYDNGVPALKTALQYAEIYQMRVFVFGETKKQTGKPDLYRMAADIYHGNKSFQAFKTYIPKKIKQYCPFNKIALFFSYPRNCYVWDQARYFLIQYDLYLQQQQIQQQQNTSPYFTSPQPIEYADVSIEHVLPQEYTKDAYWLRHFESAAKCDEYLNNIGNLSLCGKDWNSSYGFKSFPEKKQSQPRGYIHSPYCIERDFSQYEHWNETNIINRRNQMVQWAITRWNI